jgi:DNA-binding CsgD family transcriptional regulator
MTLDGTYVGLCDWHGQLVWKSGSGVRVQVGDCLWRYASKTSSEVMQQAVARVATLREQCTIEVYDDQDHYFRLWLWPLNDPDIAICVLAMRIPSQLALLTARERDCLRCLAQGMTTRQLARELDIGLTTVHTHLRRGREKLGLDSVEALIGFAARYFYCPAPCEDVKTVVPRKRSG